VKREQEYETGGRLNVRLPAVFCTNDHGQGEKCVPRPRPNKTTRHSMTWHAHLRSRVTARSPSLCLPLQGTRMMAHRTNAADRSFMSGGKQQTERRKPLVCLGVKPNCGHSLALPARYEILLPSSQDWAGVTKRKRQQTWNGSHKHQELSHSIVLHGGVWQSCRSKCFHVPITRCGTKRLLHGLAAGFAYPTPPESCQPGLVVPTATNYCAWHLRMNSYGLYYCISSDRWLLVTKRSRLRMLGPEHRSNNFVTIDAMLGEPTK